MADARLAGEKEVGAEEILITEGQDPGRNVPKLQERQADRDD